MMQKRKDGMNEITLIIWNAQIDKAGKTAYRDQWDVDVS
jgi:hypothetical protein